MPHDEHKKRHKKSPEDFETPQGGPVPSYEGFSAWNEESTAEQFHEAVKAAALAAAERAGDDGIDLPAWYEVTRVRILVGNPNVKVYGATITKSAPPPA